MKRTQCCLEVQSSSRAHKDPVGKMLLYQVVIVGKMLLYRVVIVGKMLLYRVVIVGKMLLYRV